MTKTSNKSEPSTPNPATRTQVDSVGEQQQQGGVSQEDIYSVPVKRKGRFFHFISFFDPFVLLCLGGKCTENWNTILKKLKLPSCWPFGFEILKFQYSVYLKMRDE